MSNWVEGALRVRGEIENLKKFSEECLLPVSRLGETRKNLKIEIEDGNIFESVNDTLYLSGTHLNFCDPDYIDVHKRSDSKLPVLVMPFAAAWRVDAYDLARICQEYHVDMKLFGVECGMQFCQDIEIVNGAIKKNDKIRYDDWDWECPFHRMGG